MIYTSSNIGISASGGESIKYKSSQIIILEGKRKRLKKERIKKLKALK